MPVPRESTSAQDASPDESTLLGDSIYRRLRDQILAGELEPGRSLSVPKLAAQLSVSRSPVREAVQRLIYEGLAVHIPFAGASVVKIDANELRAVFRVREALDGLAAYEAALLIGHAGLTDLRTNLDQQRANLESGVDEHRDTTLDLEFHQLIRDAAGNEPLTKALSRLETMAHLHRSSMWQSERNRRLGVKEHEEIWSAMESGDASRARRVAEAHVAGILVRMNRS